MRIKKIRFKAGTSPGQPPLEIEPGHVTILVGPNNSGKSEGLKDIHGHLRGSRTGKVVEKIEMSYPSVDDLWKMLQDIGGIERVPGERYDIPDGSLAAGAQKEAGGVLRSNLQNFYNNAVQGNDGMLRGNFVGLLTIHIDAVRRLTMTDGLRLADQDNPAGNFLDVLLREKRLYTLLEQVVEHAFPGIHFVIDQQKSQFRVRLSPSAIRIETQRTRHPDVAGQLERIPVLSEFGDGVKAFVGLAAGIVALGHKFIMIDDPEAFLHPPVARVLGSELVRIARIRKAQVFISTHSPFLVMGALEASYEDGTQPQDKATLVRLTYDRVSGNATARQIEPDSLRTLMRDRLLRSTEVFSGLFHSGVVVTESEEDKVFYDEINRRLVEVGRGHRDTLFVNAQNWQTTGEIVGPLREVGVPASVILDVDVMRMTARDWRHIPKSCRLSSAIISSINAVAGSIDGELDTQSKKDDFKTQGLSFLSRGCESDTRALAAQLRQYGVFVVERGELESWLRGLGVTGKSNWVRLIFQALESATVDPANDDDVWDFVNEVGKWLSRPQMGMPP